MSEKIRQHAYRMFSEAISSDSKKENTRDTFISASKVLDLMGNTVSIKATDSNNMTLTVEPNKANDVISSYNYSKVVINTVSNAPMIPSMPPILTTNGFLLQKGFDVFIVTTAHAFFSTPQTSNVENNKHTGKIQTSITVDIDGERYHFSSDDVIYSRSLDVAFIRVSGLKIGEHTKLFNYEEDFVKSVDVDLGDSCFVKYTDILSRTDSMVEGKYVPFVQGQVDMFAITNASSSGSSGSPVFNSNHKLLGMVCANPGDTNDYANMTLCVPIDTIKLLIEEGKALDSGVSNKNLDDKNIFAGVFTQSVEPEVGMYIDSSDDQLRKILKNGGGQRVVYSDNGRVVKGNKLRCWDIITKVDGKKIGGNESSLNKVLLENMDKVAADLTIEGYRISDYYAKRFLNLPSNYWLDVVGDTVNPGCMEIIFQLRPSMIKSNELDLKLWANTLKEPSTTKNNLNILFGKNDDDTDSLFYIGQQLQYSLLKDKNDFYKFNRSYATIVDINISENKITLDVELKSGQDYIFAVVPLSSAATILYRSPKNYDEALIGRMGLLQDDFFNSEMSREKDIFTDGNLDYQQKLAYFKINTDHESAKFQHNIFVFHSYVNLLFLMIAIMESSIQEKINVLQTEIKYLYGKINANNDKTDTYIQLYWIFFGCALNRFGNDAMTMFSAIPDPPIDPPENTTWEGEKKTQFEKVYDKPISSYISTMKEGEGGKGADIFNNSLFNAQNGWFYGKVSDRSSQNNELGYQANIASQQLEMILDDLVDETANTATPPFGNLTTIAYFMELSGVSWNNLLIAHNWRKKKGMKSKLIFEKI